MESIEENSRVELHISLDDQIAFPQVNLIDTIFQISPNLHRGMIKGCISGGWKEG